MLSFLNGKLIAKLGFLAAFPSLVAAYSTPEQVAAVPDNLSVLVAPRDAPYRIAGEFTRDGKVINAPLINDRRVSGLVVMRTQVSAADFGQCVRDGGCRALDGRVEPRPDLPAVGVSWEDATAYARWFSRKTGQPWRLPTDREWAFFAAERFSDDAVAAAGSDFSVRWIAKYDKESSRNVTVDRTPKAIGTFGTNTSGLVDIAGNVWEWTDTCFTRQKIDGADAAADGAITNCGVRVVEGQHRAYVTNFVRDARAGGCAVGVPPANLGFRLVRDESSAWAWLTWKPWRSGKA
jgi:formylglycine-generating enzyme required for sulfatase activity